MTDEVEAIVVILVDDQTLEVEADEMGTEEV